jgi:SAM-dependent methyltransferase
LKKDNFIDPTFSYESIDTYLIRRSIFKALKSTLALFDGKLLDIGCGKMPYKEFILENSSVSKYVGLDIENALEYDKEVKPDYTWDGVKMPFNDNQYDCAIGTEVLEHCPEPEVVLKETHRVLKPGGIFFFTVPFLWNLHEVPHDEYRYTPFSLERHLKNSGFKDIEIQPTGGWHLAMAQMLGLWLKRSPVKVIGGFRKSLITLFIKIIMKKVIQMSRFEQVLFREGQMITGLYGFAKKD